MPFRILVLHDGKAGHASQALGLAQLIRRWHHQPVDIIELAMAPRLKLLNRLLRLWARLPSRHLQRLLPFCYHQHRGRCQLDQHRPDLIVSFGGNVLALNMGLSRYWQTPNVVIGNTYAQPSGLITANVTQQGNPARANAVASLIPLGRASAPDCQRAARVLPASPLPRWTLLIGDDGSGYHYTPEDWQRLAAAANTLARRHRIRWLITTSRRTAPAAHSALGRALEPSSCEILIDGNRPTDIGINALLGAGEQIFCTEDSMSMLAEAIAMHKPVVSLQPARPSPRPGHAQALSYLQEVGLVTRLSIADAAQYTPGTWQPQRNVQAHGQAIYRQLIRLNVIADPIPGALPLLRPV